jgi:hypothetical protein
MNFLSDYTTEGLSRSIQSQFNLIQSQWLCPLSCFCLSGDELSYNGFSVVFKKIRVILNMNFQLLESPL